MVKKSRRNVLKIASTSLVAGSLLPTVSASDQGGPRASLKEYEQTLDEAKAQFRDYKKDPLKSGVEGFKEVISDSNVNLAGVEKTVELPDKRSDRGDIQPERHRKSKMDVNFYLAGMNLVCPAAEDGSAQSDTPPMPDAWDVFFYFEHNPPWWSVGGQKPNDILVVSFADRNWYIPSNPRMDTSSRVSKKKEDAYGMVFEYEDYKWGNNEEMAQIQVKPDEDDVDNDARQVFGTYSHHWSSIDVESVTITAGGGVSVTVSDSDKQWILNNDPDTGESLKSSVADWLC